MPSQRPIAAEDLLALRFASDPQISPDGTRVAFVLTTIDREASTYRSAVWMAPIEGGPAQIFTAGARRESSPRWSPDGRWLAFVSDRSDPRPQLHVIPAHGGEARRLATLPGGVSELAWAPDSRHLAVVSRTGLETEADPNKPPRFRHLTRLKHRYDGEGYFDGSRKHLFVLGLDEPEPRQLTAGDWDDVNPAWSPDGTRLAFASNRSPERDLNNVADLWVVAAAGGEPARVTRSRGPAAAPAWSPDGEWLAFVGQARPNDYAANWGIWLVQAGGGEAVELTAEFDRSVGSDLLTDTRDHAPSPIPTWTTDGRSLYFLASDQGDTHLYRVDLDGPQVTRLVAGPRQIMSFSLAADGQIIAFDASEPTNPGDLWAVSADGLHERRLTEVNQHLLAEVELAEPEAFRYPSSDGELLDGWLLKPPGFQAGQRFPLVLQVHGGPHALYGNTFMHEFQLLAARGYLVLYANPRGSRGYGQTLAEAVRGAWGSQDYEDVLAAVDWALEQGYADPARLGVCGGSYGGYMANWIVGHTDRFGAAVAERSVANLFSMYGTTDIPGFAEYEWLGPWWEQPELYRRLSPLTYAQQVRTPLLILHSEQDLRCPIEQAEQLFVALKRLGRTVEFVRFPEESHNLSRSGRPDRRLERLARIAGWFDRYLGVEIGGGLEPARSMHE
ncbi:MAG: S9 family peptidase [Chloroflexi bacterium]|nr:S9 family peptidase [Chloroflexota bacterium]